LTAQTVTPFGQLQEIKRTATPMAAANALRRAVSFSEADVLAFVGACGDANPLHRRPSDSNAEPVVPGMLTASLFPAIVGSEAPGSVYMSQTLSFRQVLRAGDGVIADVQVLHRRGRTAKLSTTAFRPLDGEVLLDGTAHALLPREDALDPYTSSNPSSHSNTH
jgi:3-hydroxybutyryl-CoA dehydratase